MGRVYFGLESPLLHRTGVRLRGGFVACGARKVCRRRSGGVLVLVDEAVASGGSEHRDARWRGVGWLGLRCRGSLFERLVGPVLVVVSDVVAHEAFELWSVPDDGAVEEFSADRADPAFGERVRHWSADGGLEDLEALSSEHLVERFDELAACGCPKPCRGWSGGVLVFVDEAVAA